MKNTTNTKTRMQGKQELMRVFRECHFKDALTLEDCEKTTVQEFIYYYNAARSGQIGNYVVYEVISSDPMRRADDVVVAREFYAQIDVFSVKSFESASLQDTLAKLEDRLIVAGFEIDMRDENYEPDTRLYHQTLFISKQY